MPQAYSKIIYLGFNRSDPRKFIRIALTASDSLYFVRTYDMCPTIYRLWNLPLTDMYTSGLVGVPSERWRSSSAHDLGYQRRDCTGEKSQPFRIICMGRISTT